MKRVLPRQAGLADITKTMFANRKIPKYSLILMFQPVKILRSLVKDCSTSSKNRTSHLLNTMPYIASKYVLFVPVISAILVEKMTFGRKIDIGNIFLCESCWVHEK